MTVVLLFSSGGSGGISRVSAEGGKRVPIPVASFNERRKDTVQLWPYFLPDGQHFLYLVRASSEDLPGVYVGSIESAVRQRLIASDSNAVYAEGFLSCLSEEGRCYGNRSTRNDSR